MLEYSKWLFYWSLTNAWQVQLEGLFWKFLFQAVPNKTLYTRVSLKPHKAFWIYKRILLGQEIWLNFKFKTRNLRIWCDNLKIKIWYITVIWISQHQHLWQVKMFVFLLFLFHRLFYLEYVLPYSIYLLQREREIKLQTENIYLLESIESSSLYPKRCHYIQECVITFQPVYSNSKEVTYIQWENKYSNLKVTCHMIPNFL